VGRGWAPEELALPLVVPVPLCVPVFAPVPELMSGCGALVSPVDPFFMCFLTYDWHAFSLLNFGLV
jgi:hypothetical protein